MRERNDNGETVGEARGEVPAVSKSGVDVVTSRSLFALIGLVGAVYLAWLIAFVAVPAEPFGFYKDLGFNWELVEWARVTLKGPVDLVDAIGWTPWSSSSLFYLNSIVGDVPAILIAKVLGNSWLAIKCVEVIQVVCAGVGASLFSRFAAGRSRTWSAIFGLLYAAAPETQLTIRWNQDFGWIVALMPWALVANAVLTRRYGARAFPIVGVIGGCAGYLVAFQFLAFVSVPIFAVSVAASRVRRSLASVAFFVVGLATTCALGAFYVLPTFVHPLYSDSVQRTESLQSAAFLGDFNESLSDVVALIEREWHLSPVAEFNVGGSTAGLVPVGLLVIVSAIGFLIAAARSRSTEGYRSAGTIGILVSLVFLSLGPAIPFGREFWLALYAIPHVDGIRTTDRFMAVPFFFVIFWFAGAMERIAARVGRSFKPVALGCVLVTTVTWLSFGAATHSFFVDATIGSREPRIDDVRRVVERDGTRTASFLGVNGGASEDSAVYGRPAPFDFYVDTDLGSRFLLDGVAGMGVLGRVSIASIVSGPNWIYDQPYWPATNDLFRSLPNARTTFSSDGVMVTKIPAVAPVSSIDPVCVVGGPGQFDYLDLVPELRDTGFTESSECDANVGLIDFDPLDYPDTARTVARYSGAQLAPAADRLRDRDYRLALNRTFLNIPWYRNSIDGDRPVFDVAGSVQLATGQAIVIPVERTWPAGSQLGVRIATHGSLTLVLCIADLPCQRDTLTRTNGFRWATFRLLARIAPRTLVTLRAEDQVDAGQLSDSWSGNALDGVAITDPSRTSTRPTPSVKFVAASLSRAVPIPERRAEPVDLAPIGRQKPIASDGFVEASIAHRSVLVASKADATATYAWKGDAAYVSLEVAARLLRPYAILALQSGSARTTATNVSGDTILRLRTHLSPGSIFTVRYITPDYEASLRDHLDSVRAVPVQQPPIIFDPSGASERRYDFRSGESNYHSATHLSNGIVFDDGGLHGRSGAEADLAFDVPSGTTAVSVRAVRVGPPIAADVRCGRAHQTMLFTDATDTIVSLTPDPHRCLVRFRWQDDETELQNVAVTFTSVTSFRRHLDVWLPAGTFDKEIVSDLGVIDGRPALSWPGCSESAARCTVTSARWETVDVGPSAPARGDIVFANAAAEREPPAVAVEPIASERWRVDVKTTTSLRLTELFDGNWQLLKDAATSGPIGEPCDIAATCFERVPSGTYTIVHRYGSVLSIGLLTTGTTILFTLLCLALPFCRARGEARSG